MARETKATQFELQVLRQMSLDIEDAKTAKELAAILQHEHPDSIFRLLSTRYEPKGFVTSIGIKPKKWILTSLGLQYKRELLGS